MDIKEKYQECLKRYHKACAYMDDPSIPMEKKEKYMPEFLKVIEDCRVLYDALSKGGQHGKHL
ncbi:hypothetical protein [Anaerosolibacter sp.]|uniref:hypothetical protein n=1 Tax=Anaerosolibacter sp. TaxID=1872527 RepID=UPI0039EDF0FD